MTEVENVLTRDQKDTLDELISQYNETKDTLESLKAKEKSLNMILKQTLRTYGVSKYSSDMGCTLSLSERDNISWDESALLYYCKQLNIPDLIVTKEEVNMDYLESLLYTKKIDPNSIKEFQIVKPKIETLRLSQKKVLKE